MGWTTIIEINHDFAGEVEENSELLLAAVRRRMRQGDGESPISGVRFVKTFYRSGTGFDQKWEEFKRSGDGPFYVFAGDVYYPSQGLGDFRGGFRSLVAARERALEVEADWVVIVTPDVTKAGDPTFKIVEEYPSTIYR